jgi:FlaA1/EpsC-like NDP-sugar epimerase
MISSSPFLRFASMAILLFLSTETSYSFSLYMNSQNIKTNIIAGATGYIGKSVVRESVRQGYKTVALVRSEQKVKSKEGRILYGDFFEGAEVIECDVSDPQQLTKVRFICSHFVLTKSLIE